MTCFFNRATRLLAVHVLTLGLAACGGDKNAFPPAVIELPPDQPLSAGTAIDARACIERTVAPVTTSTGGSGCALDAALGLLSPVCEISEPQRAADGDALSFAAITFHGQDLGVLGSLMDMPAQASLTAAVGGGALAAFEIEAPSFSERGTGLDGIRVESLFQGQATGQSLELRSGRPGPADDGNRFLAGFVATQPFDAVRITVFGTLVADRDETVFIYDSCADAR